MSDTEQAQAPVASTSTQPKTLSTEGQANRIRPWKAARTGGSTARVQQSKRLSRKWADRQEERKRDDAVKQLEREMKDDKKAEIDRRTAARKERQQALEEKRRLAAAAEKMSAKRLQRLKKWLGRSKKVAA